MLYQHVSIRSSATKDCGAYPDGSSTSTAVSIGFIVSSFRLSYSSRLMEVVRADIHIAYDDDLWTFVPDLKMLKMIELSLKQLITEAKAHCIDQVWNHGVYRPSRLHHFQIDNSQTRYE